MAGSRLLGGLDRAAPRPRRRGPVPRQPGVRPAHRPRRAARRRRARLGDALDRRSGQGRAGARVEARGPARVRRGGRRPREVQAAPPPRRAEARPRRAPGRARPRRRGRGAQAACGRSRSRPRPPSGPRSSASRSRRSARGSRSSTSRTPARGAPRPRSAETLRSLARAGRRAGSRGCSQTVHARRTSSRTPPDAARRRWRRSTGCRAGSSGSSSGASPRRRSCERLRGRGACAPEHTRTPTTSAAARARGRRGGRSARAAERERVELAERAVLVRERTRALEQALAEQEGLPPAARALAEEGAPARACGDSTSTPGAERAVAAALRTRRPPFSPTIRRSGSRYSSAPARPGSAASPCSSGRPAGARGRVSGRPARRCCSTRTCRRSRRRASATTRRAASSGSSARRPRRCYWSSRPGGRRSRRRRPHSRSARPLRRPRPSEAAERARLAEVAYGRAIPKRRASIDARTLERLVLSARALRDGVSAAQRAASRFDAPLRARVDAGSSRSGELGDELRRLGAAEVSLRRELEEASAAVTAAEVEIARIDAETRRRRGASRRRATIEPAEGDDREELVGDASSGSRCVGSTLGQVNPLANEEYEAREGAARRPEDAARGSRAEPRGAREAARRAHGDRRAALRRDVRGGRASTSRRSRRRSSPAARARLRLVEPEDEDGEPGVEVELRPAGKRVTRLSLLSGGEKALGAISFLFALFLARPCAFYLLDEVEAALDDTNIARFVELLRRYSDRAQFVVVTHQKRTMEAADILYGVTMGPDGVSQVVSRRLPSTSSAEHAAA